jgi:oxygen-independent coproporphyrinogen-3 oxidase
MNLGVYIHVPFCEARCPHCDFVTTDREDLHRRFRVGYVDTLRREWALWRGAHPDIGEGHLRSIYLGGGTPNLLRPEEIAPILTEIRAGVGRVDPEIEITAEMNPGHCDPHPLAPSPVKGEGGSDAETMHRWREVGLNRVSLGVQSTEDRLLKTLGRTHTAGDARRAFETARAAGFANVNCDLIFAIPGQTISDWESTLREIGAWGPDHVSTYNLTAKDQTPLAAMVRAGELTLPDEETQWEMFMRADAVLSGAGLAHYEISNFARPGRECRHNGDVWRGVPYIGLGLGAHSCFAGQRLWNTAVWEDYHREIAEGKLPQRRDDARTEEGQRAEELYLGLRTRDGVPLNGKSSERIDALVKESLAVCAEDRLRLTVEGWAVADAIVAALI